MNNQAFNLLVIINIFLSIVTFFIPINPMSFSIMSTCGWVCCLLEITANNIKNN